jgi:hypothetical protein
MLKDKFKALPNGVAIGDGLYHLLQSFSLLSSLEENYYHFEKIVMPEHQQTKFNNYPLYSQTHPLILSSLKYEELADIPSKSRSDSRDAGIRIALLLVVSINYTIKSHVELNYL